MSLNSGRTVQCKRVAQSLRPFGLHGDVNDAHRAGAGRVRGGGERLFVILDSGAAVHLVCPAHKHFFDKRAKVEFSVTVETAGGDLTLDVIGTCSVAASCVMVVCSTPCSQSVSSALPEVRKMDIYERCPEGYGMLKGPRGNVKLERSGGLDYLVGGEGQASLGVSGVCVKIGTSHSASRKSGSHRFARNFCRLEQEGDARHQNCNLPQ